MVNEGIVLGHKISERGIEVDKDKVDAIENNVGDIAYRELIDRPMIRGKSASLSAYRPIYRHIG